MLPVWEIFRVSGQIFQSQFPGKSAVRTVIDRFVEFSYHPGQNIELPFCRWHILLTKTCHSPAILCFHTGQLEYFQAGGFTTPVNWGSNVSTPVNWGSNVSTPGNQQAVIEEGVNLLYYCLSNPLDSHEHSYDSVIRVGCC